MFATTNAEYRRRLANALRACRLRAGLDHAEMAALVSIKGQFETPVTPAMLAAWEDDAVITERPAGAFLAAYEIAGVRGLSDLEAGCVSNEELELERYLREVRALVDDPTALMRRAKRLMAAS